MLIWKYQEDQAEELAAVKHFSIDKPAGRDVSSWLLGYSSGVDPSSFGKAGKLLLVSGEMLVLSALPGFE